MSKKRAGQKYRRIFAWILTLVMLCTGANVTVAAQDMTFSSEITTEVQQQDAESEEDISSEVSTETEDAEQSETTEKQEVAEDPEGESFGNSKTQENVFSDGTQEEVFSDSGTENETTPSKTVYFSVSDDEVYVSERGKLKKPVALQRITVPYFDLALYGLEQFYYLSPEDSAGGLQKGTKETAANKVTMLHLFIYATEVLYCGVDESEAGKGYLKEKGLLGDNTLEITGTSGSMFINNFWDMDLNLTYYLNYEYPMASPGLGATADQILLRDDDVITLSHYSYMGFFMDEEAGFNYLKVEDDKTCKEVVKGIDQEVCFEVYRTGKGMGEETEQKKAAGEYALFYIPAKDMQSGRVSSWNLLGITDNEGNLNVDLTDIPEGEYFVALDGQPGKDATEICSSPGGIYLTVKPHECQWGEGEVTKAPTCTEEGVRTYTCSICGQTKTEPVSATGHKITKWTKISDATVFQPQKQQGTCSLCGKKFTRDYGKKLTATIKLNLSSLTLQKKQSTKAVKVTMAKGDSVKSWTSSNSKVVAADKNGVIKAGTKTGSATITVTLKSGKKATVKVKVQTAKVATTKISGLKSKITLGRGRLTTLKPVISPVTSQYKVTYTSSNKSVATVSKNGVIKAGKKKGTARITVRSGKKSYVVNVTVK